MRTIESILLEFSRTEDVKKLLDDLKQRCRECNSGRVDAISDKATIKQTAVSLGKRGGDACKKKHGDEFYKELSKKGIEARRKKKEEKELAN